MATTSNYSILSNGGIENGEKLDEKKKQILDGIKMDLLETLKDERIVNRNLLADELSKNRYNNGVSHKNNGIPGGMIRLNDSVSINLDDESIQQKYEGILGEYNDALTVEPEGERKKVLDELDTRFAEMLILDSGNFIEFRSNESFAEGKNADEESRLAYEGLNKVKKYKRKIERLKRTDERGDFYVIKWKDEELKAIKDRFEKEIKKDEEPKNPENQNKPEETGKSGDEATKETATHKKETPESDKKDNEELDALRKKQEELEEKLRKSDKDNEELRNTIKDLINKLNEKKEDTQEESDHNDDKKLEDDNIDDDFFKDLDDIDSSEILDENPNYILRSLVVEQVLKIRKTNGYPEGTIEIKGESINVEEFEFYEELKEEYINAKGNSERLTQLDKEFAELIILFSPRDSEFKDRYYIKLTEAELKDGLVVSNERLAKYGISVNVTDYFEKIVEKEVIRERKIVRKIETVITELQTSIVELTRIVDIEKSPNEVILKEIKKKKELLMILLRRQRRLLLLLTGDKNSEELKKLREQEEKLQKEYERLLEQKKKQEEIKKNITDIKKKIAELEKDDEKKKILKAIEKKGKEKKEIEEEIKKLQKRKGFIESQLELNDVALTAERIADYKSEIKEINDQIAGYQSDIKKLDEEIKELEEQLQKGDSEELKNLRDQLKNLEQQLAGMKDIDAKLEKKKQELEEIRKQIKEKSGANREIEVQLIALIEEQEILLKELETLEVIISKATTEEEKIRIREQIRIINEKITIISKKITEYEHIIQIYKEKVTVKKYRVYQATQFTPVQVDGLKLNAVISDMGTDVFEEKAALKVEEELKQQYKNLGSWDVFGRLALFLGRGSKRRKMIKQEKDNMANTAFLDDPAYSTLNEQSQNAADRHAHELATGMAAINRITTVQNQQVDQLCKDYLNNLVNDAQFQTQFNTIVAADTNIQNALDGENITHIGSNILLRLKEQKDLNALVANLDNQLSSYITTGNIIHMQNMQSMVETYIRDYQKTPAFISTFEKFVGGDINARNKLRGYLAHQKAIMKMQITNLTMNIDIINKGKSAYQIDNSDREKGWKFKVGKFMDKHPWGTALGSIALGVGLGAATAGVGAVAGAAITTGVFGAYAGTSAAIKKWTHHTKEQNTHEKNVVTDYRNEQNRIQQRQNDALNGSWWKKYKAKRQLALYNQTTQENIQLTNQITEYITNLSSKIGTLTAQEDNFMRCNLIEGWARLKYYREMGHNFLASENVDSTEKDMARLEKAITLGLQKINQTTTNIETTMTATNSLGSNITYDVIRNDLKASYDKSLIQFKRERRNLALKYGIGTAAASIGTALGLQYLTGTGVFAEGTAPVAPTSTSYSGGTDNFGLGKDDLTNGAVYSSTKSAITSSGAPNGSELTFNYGVGTDGTNVVSGFSSASKAASLTTDFANISIYPNLSPTQVSSLQSEISKIASDPSFISAFKDPELARERAMESIEHFARALNDSGRPDLLLKFNHTGSIPGMTNHNLAERFMTGAIDITTPGKPGTDPVKRGRWFMGVPLFFNTFKDRKGENDTTDQTWNNPDAQQQNNP